MRALYCSHGISYANNANRIQWKAIEIIETTMHFFWKIQDEKWKKQKEKQILFILGLHIDFVYMNSMEHKQHFHKKKILQMILFSLWNFTS